MDLTKIGPSILILVAIAACSPKVENNKTPAKKADSEDTDDKNGDASNRPEVKVSNSGTIKSYGGSYVKSSMGEFCIENFSTDTAFAKEECASNSYCKWVAECPTEGIITGCATKSSKQVLWQYDSEGQPCSEKVVKSKKAAVTYLGVAETVTTDAADTDIYDQYLSLTLREDVNTSTIVSAKMVTVLLKKNSRHLVMNFDNGKYSVPYITDSGVYGVEVAQADAKVSGTFKKSQTVSIVMRSVNLYKDQALKNKACTLAKHTALPADTSLELTGTIYTLESKAFPKVCKSNILYADPRYITSVVRK